MWIETTRPGTLAALGLGPDDVLARNPELVITSITDFGQTGDYRDWQGDDAVHAAMSGILSRSGLAGRDPLPAARDGVRDDRDPGRMGDARRLLEPARDRPRRSRRLLDPRGGDADHGPRLRHRVREPRLGLPLDPRAAGGWALPDLPVRGRPRPRRRAGAAPVAGDARLAGRARRLPGRAVDAIPARLEASPSCTSSTPRYSRHDEGRDRGRGPGARRAGRAGPRSRRRARQPPLRVARRVRRRRGRAGGARPAAERILRDRRRARRLPPPRARARRARRRSRGAPASGRRGGRRDLGRRPPCRAGRSPGCA